MILSQTEKKCKDLGGLLIKKFKIRQIEGFMLDISEEKGYNEK